jgi:hypothetical protein|nr:MAG TPA: acid phosphatase [Caudoviricetes sp.]
MRDLNQYDVIFCDIDDTLVHGIWTDLMSVTWKIFRNKLLAEILMELQAALHIFKSNQKLRHMLMQCEKPIIFLTARKECLATHTLLKFMLDKGDLDFSICSLATDTPAVDKINKIVFFMQTCMYDKVCLFDDNVEVRRAASQLDIDVFDPTTMFEEKIG